MSRLDFLRQKAPDNYVAGIGRGATGFTTRSDIGPAREGPTEAALVAALERAVRSNAGTADDEDAFAEDEVGLFAGSEWQDQEDDEADRVFESVEAKLDRRRAARKLERQRIEKEEYAKKNPTIAEQFADAKRALATVTDDEWANLPDVGDITGRNKRRQNLRERTYTGGDTLLLGALNSTQFNSSVDAGTNGDDTPMGGIQTDFVEMGAARDRLLASSLESARSGTES